MTSKRGTTERFLLPFAAGSGIGRATALALNKADAFKVVAWPFDQQADVMQNDGEGCLTRGTERLLTAVAPHSTNEYHLALRCMHAGRGNGCECRQPGIVGQ
jgi:hypothetical protein